MAVLHECSCSNPSCSCEYRFTSGGIGFSRRSYWQYHAEITQAIAAGKYGRELQHRMKSPDSVYITGSNEYAYCPGCDEIHFGGRIAVYIHKKENGRNWNTMTGLTRTICPALTAKRLMKECFKYPPPAGNAGARLRILTGTKI